MVNFFGSAAVAGAKLPAKTAAMRPMPIRCLARISVLLVVRQHRSGCGGRQGKTRHAPRVWVGSKGFVALHCRGGQDSLRAQRMQRAQRNESANQVSQRGDWKNVRRGLSRTDTPLD